jgi:ribosomal protein S2
MSEEKVVLNPQIERMFRAGAHFGYSKSRRHPSARPLIFGTKNKVEIFDLEKTQAYLEKAKEFVIRSESTLPLPRRTKLVFQLSAYPALIAI